LRKTREKKSDKGKKDNLEGIFFTHLWRNGMKVKG
jgi:hypothetical protein